MKIDLFIFSYPLGKEVLVMEAQGKKGQGMVEYALILVLVAMVIFIAVSIFGSGVGNLYQTIISSI